MRAPEQRGKMHFVPIETETGRLRRGRASPRRKQSCAHTGEAVHVKCSSRALLLRFFSTRSSPMGLASPSNLWSPESRQQRGLRAHRLTLYCKKATKRFCVIGKPRILGYEMCRREPRRKGLLRVCWCHEKTSRACYRLNGICLISHGRSVLWGLEDITSSLFNQIFVPAGN